MHIWIDIRMGETLAAESHGSLRYICHEAKIISLKCLFQGKNIYVKGIPQKHLNQNTKSF